MSSFFDEASLVFIPSGYKTSKAYSVKPTSGDGDLAFTRSNDTATRVNSAGLIEKVRTNLILQSNSFDTTWVNVNSTDTSGEAGYDGTNNAWLLENTIAGPAYLRQTISASGLNTFSIYAKAGTADFLILFAGGGASPYAFFNLSTGEVGSSFGGTPRIVSVGSGWYRCSFSFTDTITSVRAYVSEANGSFSSTIGATIVVQAAQLETGDIATDYIATTSAAVSVGPVANVPRLDYLGSSCPRLLLEPQRTNLARFSEQFDNAAWLTYAGATVTANTELSPDGTQNADTISFGSSDDSQVYQLLSASSATYTISFWAKSSTAKKFRIKIWNNVVNTFTNDYTTTSNWQRFTYTFTKDIVNYAIANQAAGGTGDIQIWGAQLEAGAYATSYIPTLGAAVTRGADAASKTGISSLIGQTEGTMFFEGTIEGINPTTARRIISLSDGTNNNLFQVINLDNSLDLRCELRSGGSSVFTINASSAFSLGQKFKFAFAYANNDFAFYINGVQAGTSTSGSAIATSVLQFARGDGANPFEGTNSQLLLFKTRLTNAQLAELTTL